MKSLDPNQIEEIRSRIIDLFLKNVKGRTPDLSSYNLKHAGKGGHWLEIQMGLTPNANNSADFEGFEMKNNTTSKTTFGDWSADYYVFKDQIYNITRDDFLKIFGMPNILKNGRYSWSGKSCPKIGDYNPYGQMLLLDDKDNILALYSFKHDLRQNKSEIVPPAMQQNELVLAKWSAKNMRKKVERKFNKFGWFKCVKNKEGVYINIVFGDPINFKTWIKFVKQGLIFFDSGMYQGNDRNYSQWRANNLFWQNLITSTY